MKALFARSLGATLLFSSLILPATVATANDYKLSVAAGKFTTVKDLVLHDARRNKDIHLRIKLPEFSAGSLKLEHK